MPNHVKQRKWKLLSKEEGSMVVDRRRGSREGFDPTVESTTLAKISRYLFKRRVIFKGFDEIPNVSHTRSVRESNNCISPEHKNVVIVGSHNMFWFLRKKEK